MVFLFDSTCGLLIKYMFIFFNNFKGSAERGPDRGRWYNLQSVFLYKDPESLCLFFFQWQSLATRKKNVHSESFHILNYN